MKLSDRKGIIKFVIGLDGEETCRIGLVGLGADVSLLFCEWLERGERLFLIPKFKESANERAD